MMEPLNGSSFLNSYLEANKKLIKTITIKSSVSADLTNTYIEQTLRLPVNYNEPRTWKYYLNLSGMYHITDVPMNVTSLDTLEEIVFSKQNLKEHTATAQAYQYGSRYYYSLISRFPDQEPLINGILNAVDLDIAVAAADGTILGYRSDLVEPQEATLMSDLQTFINHIKIRWNNTAFGLSDSLYHVTQHAIMYMGLLPKVLNLRLKRCKTNEAHSFHIREYLASHRRLDVYLPYMTLKQSLYFYRNINYLERNCGKAEQFDELIEKLLTDRRIPLSDYSIRQLAEVDANLYPKVLARRKLLNVGFNGVEKDYVALENLYSKEALLSRGNQTYYESQSAKDTELFQTSSSSVIQTKDLESSMVDYSDAVPDPLETVLMREWLYTSSIGLYNSVINFKDPRTAELRSLHAKDAFIYLWYVYFKSIGYEVNTVPYFYGVKFRRLPRPSIAELMSVADDSFPNRKAVATALYNRQPPGKVYTSTSSFFETARLLYEEAKLQWYEVSNEEDLHHRAMLESMTLKFYGSETIHFDVSGTSIGDWLSVNNLPVYDYSYEQASALITEIITNSTGLKINDALLLKNIQKAMLSMLSDLSSYSIQIIKEINESKIIPLNWAAIRIGNIRTSAKDTDYLKQVVDVTSKDGSGTSSVNLTEQCTNMTHTVTAHDGMQMEISSSLAFSSNETRKVTVPMTVLDVNLSYTGYDPTVSDKYDYYGAEYFLNLTLAQRIRLSSLT